MQPPPAAAFLGSALCPSSAGQLATGERRHGDARHGKSGRDKKCYNDLIHGFPLYAGHESLFRV